MVHWDTLHIPSGCEDTLCDVTRRHAVQLSTLKYRDCIGVYGRLIRMKSSYKNLLLMQPVPIERYYGACQSGDWLQSVLFYNCRTQLKDS